MCLDILSTTKKELLPRRGGYGWKNFDRFGGKLFGIHKGIYVSRPMRKWINERDFRDLGDLVRIRAGVADRGRWYPTGWHIYISTNGRGFGEVYDLPNARIVKFRKPVAKGRERGGAVLVAKEICILTRRESIKWLKKNRII